jgi:perosamine synthetase
MTETNSTRMTVSQDQFWSFGMMSLRRGSYEVSPTARVRYAFTCARNALFNSLKPLGIKPGDHVLVPAYVCRAAIDPLRAYGVNVNFYAIGRKCEPILEDIEQRIGPRARALLLVHYFGFPQAIAPIRNLCNRYKIMLIEDCAHVL